MRAAWLLGGLLAVTGACDEPSGHRAPPTASVVESASPSSSTAPALVAAPSRASVDAVVAEQRVALVEACFARHAVGDGSVELELIAEIDGDGRVKDATVAGGGAALKPLRRCVAEHARGWRFPRSREGGTVTATVELGPRSGE